MAAEPKQSQENFGAFPEGTPCAEMARKMMAGKKEGRAFDCAAMMSKMMPLCRKFMDQRAEPDEKKKEVPGFGQ